MMKLRRGKLQFKSIFFSLVSVTMVFLITSTGLAYSMPEAAPVQPEPLAAIDGSDVISDEGQPCDMFLKVDGIPGEVMAEGYEEWIDVYAYSTGLSQPVGANPSLRGGAAASRVQFQDFSITKKLDKASPKLALACAKGTHIPEVKLVLRKAGEEPQKFMEYKLGDVLITSVTTGGTSTNCPPEEKVTFSFTRIEWAYTFFDVTGAPSEVIEAKWDLAANKGS